MRRPIHYAAENGHASVIQLLLRNGAILQNDDVIIIIII